MDGELTLTALAKELDLPESNLRRFASKHGSYFQTRQVGRRTLYAPEAGRVLEHIAALYARGLTAEQVEQALSESMPQRRILDVAPVVDDPPEPPAPLADVAGLAILAPILQEFVAAQSRLAAAMERRNEIMERRLEALEKAAEVRTIPASSNAPQAATSRREATRAEIIARVHELRQDGLGKKAIVTAMTREGWPTISGRGEWAAGTVKRIIDGEVQG